MTTLGMFLFAAAASDFVEVDYARIDRTIAREPTYVAEPRYALFILDPAGKVRVWAVLDKSKKELPNYDVLYFDRNANGDLTEAGERFAAATEGPFARPGLSGEFRVGDFKVPGTDLVHTGLRFATFPKSGRKGVWFQMRWNGRNEISGGFSESGINNTIYGKTPREAPVLRPTPLGRFTFGIWGAAAFWIGGENHLSLLVGNGGSGRDTISALDENFLVPGKDRIRATVIARDRQGREVKASSEIPGHC
jgi:hypothetical protein